jgi:hypothetical protein
MRLLLIVSLVLCETLHAIVLLENPLCGGLVVSSQAILTLKECISSSSELVAPIKLKPTHFLMHGDKQVGLLIFDKPLPYKPIPLGASRNNLQEQHIAHKVSIGNSVQSTDSSITQISEIHLWASRGVSPVLPGAPMWSIKSQSQSYTAIGLMVAETQALKLDPYTDFINSYVDTPSTTTQKIISLPAITVREQKPIASLDAYTLPENPPHAPATAQATTPATAPLSPPASEQIKRSGGAESIGCACSQTRVSLGRRGFLRRLLGN